jgi:hypothetical protein
VYSQQSITIDNNSSMIHAVVVLVAALHLHPGVVCVWLRVIACQWFASAAGYAAQAVKGWDDL